MRLVVFRGDGGVHRMVHGDELLHGPIVEGQSGPRALLLGALIGKAHTEVEEGGRRLGFFMGFGQGVGGQKTSSNNRRATLRPAPGAVQQAFVFAVFYPSPSSAPARSQGTAWRQ